MRKTLLAISILLILHACGQIHKDEREGKNDIFFEALISPALDEHAEVSILKKDTTQTIRFLLKDAGGNDKPSDTFYIKAVTLSERQFHKVDTAIFQRILIGHSLQKSGFRDGIRFRFTLAHNGDTSILFFVNPQKGIGSNAFEIIKKGIDNFQEVFNDSIINDYLDDVQTYIDNSHKDLPRNSNRPIDKLRRIRYNR